MVNTTAMCSSRISDNQAVSKIIFTLRVDWIAIDDELRQNGWRPRSQSWRELNQALLYAVASAGN